MKRVYKTKSCHSKQADAKKQQAKMHKLGLTARVVKTKSGKSTKFCVQSAGKRKK